MSIKEAIEEIEKAEWQACGKDVILEILRRHADQETCEYLKVTEGRIYSPMDGEYAEDGGDVKEGSEIPLPQEETLELRYNDLKTIAAMTASDPYKPTTKSLADFGLTKTCATCKQKHYRAFCESHMGDTDFCSRWEAKE